MAKRWEKRNNAQENKIAQLSQSLGISEVLSTVLVNRGMTDEDSIMHFLYPDLKDMPSPFLIEGMEKAVNRIISALHKHEKIMLYGDYDVDGISSVSIVYLFLKSVGAAVGYYIPSRLKEGYGLNKESIKKFINGGCSLLVTLDCGISNAEEIAFARRTGSLSLK
ncbi:MAG: DHH family phosphoesterase [Deltaproteobacteria bacterium]|nr:DHH family phosphoesterase [Deltaproteobacteria bacterium]